MKEKTFELIKTYLKDNKAKIQRTSVFEKDGFKFTIEVEDITIVGKVITISTQEKTLNGKKTIKFDLTIKFYKNNDLVYELYDKKTFDESAIITENIFKEGYPAADIYNICVNKIKEEITKITSLEKINEILENNL